MIEVYSPLGIWHFFYIVITPISTTSGLWSTGKMRKYHQIDVYIYQCVIYIRISVDCYACTSYSTFWMTTPAYSIFLSKCQREKQVKSAILSRSVLLWRQRLYNDNDFVHSPQTAHISRPSIVWKMSQFGCDKKLWKFIAMLSHWKSTPDSGPL